AALLAALTMSWVAADDKKPDYFPLAKGTKWEYQTTFRDKKADATAEVTRSETKDGKTTATILYTGDDGKKVTAEVSADEKGVYSEKGAYGALTLQGVKADR